MVAVDDGSVREPLSPAAIAAAGLDGVVIVLRRNVGHQRAIAIALAYSAEMLPNAGRFVVMDSDGEDMPSSKDSMLSVLAPGTCDVVVARRRNRVETIGFRSLTRSTRRCSGS